VHSGRGGGGDLASSSAIGSVSRAVSELKPAAAAHGVGSLSTHIRMDTSQLPMSARLASASLGASEASAQAFHSNAELRASGVDLRFVGLSFTVKNAATGDDKTILSGVSGRCAPGRLFALMGGSGAGKTTLLDILACQAQVGGRLEGQVLVNGEPRSTKRFAQLTCYVSQRDMLMASATVRECVMTSAMLRLPKTMDKAAKTKAVDGVLKELELDTCANVLVGDDAEGIKGISGGQKRRVSLAIELVKDPIVIFADEPTSGLDSEVALSIMDALLMLARKRRTVVCTIHQPNSDITDMFDDFMLLASGRCVYNGSWRAAVEWFGRQGFVTPTYKNPTDFFMSIVKDDVTAYKLADILDAEQAAALAEDPKLAAGGEGDVDSAVVGSLAGSSGFVAVDIGGGSKDTPGLRERQQPQQQPAPDGICGAAARAMAGLFLPSQQQQSGASMASQVYVLSMRSVRNWMRNPNMLMAEFVQYIGIAVFVGLMYVQFSDDADGVYDRAACIWFSLAIMSFTPSYTAATSWGRDRPLMRKELQQRQYSITSLYLSRTLTLLPVEAVQCAAFVAIMYFFCGFQPTAAKFFVFYAVLFVFQLIAEGVGLMAGIVTKQATYAIVLLTFILLVLLSFSGFLTTHIPVYFIWVNKLSFLTYAYNALIQVRERRREKLRVGAWLPRARAAYARQWEGTRLR